MEEENGTCQPDSMRDAIETRETKPMNAGKRIGERFIRRQEQRENSTKHGDEDGVARE